MREGGAGLQGLAIDGEVTIGRIGHVGHGIRQAVVRRIRVGQAKHGVGESHTAARTQGLFDVRRQRRIVVIRMNVEDHCARGRRRRAGAAAVIGYADIKAVRCRFAAIVAVGKQRNICHHIARVHDIPVIKKRALRWQTVDGVFGDGGAFGVAGVNRAAPARECGQRPVVVESHIGLALDHRDGAANTGRLVDRL